MSACSVSDWVCTDTYSPAAIDMAPATKPAIPATNMALCGTCAARQRCQGGTCVDAEACQDDNDCINDSGCACPPEIGGPGCACVPWGQKPRGDFDPRCAGQAFAPGEFKAPVLKCQWPPAGTAPRDVLTTPVVIDLDRDGLPEIIFHTAAGAFGGDGNLIALSGKDCSVRFSEPVKISL